MTPSFSGNGTGPSSEVRDCSRSARGPGARRPSGRSTGRGPLGAARGPCYISRVPLRIETCEIEDLPFGLVVSPFGPLRASTSEEFRERVGAMLGTGSIHQLVIDFGRVDSIDSSTAGFLLNIHDRLSELGGQLALAELTPTVQIVIESIGLMNFFMVCNTVEDAINELR